jgi:cyclase
MLYPRIIPCLLVRDKGLVKTVKFKDPKYVGDPINAVRIFNEKEVDELMVLDIDATHEKREPDYDMISNLAAECRMPLCYGGGVKTSEQVQKIIQLGVEKVAISSAAIENPHLLPEAEKVVGSQSIVAVLDVKRAHSGGRYEVWIRNGSVNTRKCVVEVARQMESLGAGEVVINSIDNDGLMNGYDSELVEQVWGSIGIPLTVLGGAGTLDHMRRLICLYGAIGLAAGSMFVFKGVFKAVLINYPTVAEKEALLCS